MIELVVFTAPFLIITACIVLLLVLMYAAVYDLIQQRKLRRLPSAKNVHFTIVAFVRDDFMSLEQFYNSLVSSRLRAFDIVLVRPESCQINAKAIKLLTDRSRFTTYIYSPRKTGTYFELIERAYAKSQKGEVIMLTSTDASHSRSTLKALRFGRIQLAKNTAMRLQDVNTSTGLSGAVLNIAAAFDHVLRRITILPKAAVSLEPSSAYILKPASLKQKSDMFTVRDNWDAKFVRRNIQTSVGLAVTHNMIRLVSALVALIVLLFLANAAIDGYGLEAFTITWVAAVAFGLILVIFDSFISIRQKIELVASFGFIPFLLISALLFKKT